MKKLFILAFICWPLYAAAAPAPWNVLQGFTSPSENKKEDVRAEPQQFLNRKSFLKKNPSFHMGERYLLRAILLNDGVLRVGLHLPPNKEEWRREYEQVITHSYNLWFREPARLIRQAGREQEFRAVLPLLDRGVDVRFVPMAPPVFYGEQKPWDIEFTVVPDAQIEEVCGDGTMGCHKGAYPHEKIFLSDDPPGDTFAGVALHEIGHSLGLADQYKKGYLSNAHPAIGSEAYRESVLDEANYITCDDADGIINLIDLIKQTHLGGRSGWASLCPYSNEVYLDGTALTKGPYAIISEGGWKCRLTELQNGKVVSSKVMPLDLEKGCSPLEEMPETVLLRDKAGRPVYARTEDGAELYYSYNRYESLRLMIKDGRLVQIKETELHVPQWTYFFGENGEVASFFKSVDAQDEYLFFGGKDYSIYLSANETEGILLSIRWNSAEYEGRAREYQQRGDVVTERLADPIPERIKEAESPGPQLRKTDGSTDRLSAAMKRAIDEQRKNDLLQKAEKMKKFLF